MKLVNRTSKLFTFIIVTAAIVSAALPGCSNIELNLDRSKLPRRAATLPDISGLAWIEGDYFIAVHDAKNPEELKLPRVSMLQLPLDLDGITWEPLNPKFPTEKSNDFESIAKIPDSPLLLLVESTEEQDEKPFSRRIFLTNPSLGNSMFVDVIEWPVATENVEGTAVAKVGDRLIFIWAERAEGEESTEIHYADVSVEPYTISETAGSFTPPYPIGNDARPVTGIDVDSAGVVYVSSAQDPGDDNGPFYSAVYAIGNLDDVDGEIQLTMYPELKVPAILDGIKVESLAVREPPGETLEIFVGLDDENYGGTLRLIN